MAEKSKPSAKVVLIGLLFPIFLIAAIDLSLNGRITNFGIDELNPRIANSALTAFILCTTFLLGNMFFYGESRKRPLAPLFWYDYRSFGWYWRNDIFHQSGADVA